MTAHEQIDSIKQYVTFNYYEIDGQSHLDIQHNISAREKAELYKQEVHRLRKELNEVILLAFS